MTVDIYRGALVLATKLYRRGLRLTAFALAVIDATLSESVAAGAGMIGGIPGFSGGYGALAGAVGLPAA
jgi:hypothetical protein